MKLKLGRIHYLNLYPIFHSLAKANGNYELVDGYPSMLNTMLREGRIDVSPSSSIEFVKHPEMYELIPGHSISARAEIRSILLLSRFRIEELKRKKISSTHQSETSKCLLEILLGKFYGIDTPVLETELPLSGALYSFDAYLSIGDEALLAGKSEVLESNGKYRKILLNGKEFFAYDLGTLWHKFTGASFVFALWIARKDSLKRSPALFEKLQADLDSAKEYAVSHLPEIAQSRPVSWLTPEELVSYWKIISYGFGEAEKKGLELFAKYAREMELIRKGD